MKCNQCPRECNIDRENAEGFCRTGSEFKVARAMPHYWEEPFISGTKGSGTVFFSGCNLHCIYCQNEKISHHAFGKYVSNTELMKIFDRLVEAGVHNINLVTPSHYALRLAEVLKEYKCPIPVVYNTSSYEKAETLKALEGLVDIYLPDLKYFDSEISAKYSACPDYFEVASKAVKEMFRQVGNLTLNEENIAQKGMIIRHMVLPGNISQTDKVFNWVKENFPEDIYISIMRQYTPYGKAKEIEPINRPLSSREYSIVKSKILALGFENICFQKKSSSCEDFIPSFELEGV